MVADVVALQPDRMLDVRLQTYAILAIGTHVSSWYRNDGSMSLDEVVAGYTEVILRQLGVRSPSRKATRASCRTVPDELTA